MASGFDLVTDFQLKGDQPRAVRGILKQLEQKNEHITLLGVTGSGKTFTMANVIQRAQRPALIMSHNKTLAAQLYEEFCHLFPHNRVEYFVSYYDYYQPEAYVPASDTYIEKDSAINLDLERLRHSTTHSVLSRRDTIIVASVSCIFGLGSPEYYRKMHIMLSPGVRMTRKAFIKRLVELQYERTPFCLEWGQFRVRGDTIDVFASAYQHPVRIRFFDDEVEAIYTIDALKGTRLEPLDRAIISPNNHYIAPEDTLKRATARIKAELKSRLAYFEKKQRYLEAQRLYERTMFDVENLKELGYCKGIENYALYLSDRAPGSRPYSLMDYLYPDTLVFIDESHVTMPQLKAMYRGDYARKKTLVDFGFRLPSAMDNRPLRFEEFMTFPYTKVYVSATPGDLELELSRGRVIEQIVRPTGLIDPPILVRDAENQVDDVLMAVRQQVANNTRCLITTLTKRMAEDLSRYLNENGVKALYLHSEIDTLDRVAIINKLRSGEFHCIVGVNLLREGLDLPEVSLVAVLDADKVGFLRSYTALIQTIGRASRNINGRAIFYASRVTDAMKQTIEETERRRCFQLAYNKAHGITPESIQKNIRAILGSIYEADRPLVPAGKAETKGDVEKTIARLHKMMEKKAKDLEFEEAARLRDEIARLKRIFLLT